MSVGILLFVGIIFTIGALSCLGAALIKEALEVVEE